MFVGFCGFLFFLFWGRLRSVGFESYTPIKMKENIIKAFVFGLGIFLGFSIFVFFVNNNNEVVEEEKKEEIVKEPNDNQKFLSKLAIDSGADIVIGHHPHVTQPVEKYNNGYIAYSLGNFIFDQYFSEETMRGFMLKVEIRGGEIKKVEKIHYTLNEFYQPVETEREEI